MATEMKRMYKRRGAAGDRPTLSAGEMGLDSSYPYRVFMGTPGGNQLLAYEQHVDARHYGAIGDDSVNDKVAIADAISAAISANKTLRIGQGTYRLDNTLTIPSGARIYLDGAMLHGNGVYPVLNITGDNVAIQGRDPFLSGVRFTTPSNAVAIQVNGGRKNIWLSRMYIEGSGMSATTAHNRSDCGGIVVISDKTTPDKNVVIDGCRFKNLLYGVVLFFSENCRIINCIFDWNHLGALQVNLYSTRNILVGHNTFVDSGGTYGAIEVVGNELDRNCRNISIMTNTFYGTYAYEILGLANMSHSSVIGNVAEVTGGGTNRTCLDLAQTPGAYTESVCHHNVILGNVLLASTTGRPCLGVSDKGSTNNVGANNNLVTFNQVRNNSGVGIGLAPGNCKDNVIDHNTVEVNGGTGSDGDGIYVYGEHTRVTDNDVKAERYGIFLSGATRSQVEKNYVHDCGDYGIVVGAGSGTDQTVIGNRTENNAGGILVTGTPNIRYWDNIVPEGESIAGTRIPRELGLSKPQSMANSAAANSTLYYSTTASKLVYKDSGGTVRELW